LVQWEAPAAIGAVVAEISEPAWGEIALCVHQAAGAARAANVIDVFAIAEIALSAIAWLVDKIALVVVLIEAVNMARSKAEFGSHLGPRCKTVPCRADAVRGREDPGSRRYPLPSGLAIL
jgi:hypothetical protein